MKKETLQAFCLSLQGATHDYQPEWQADRYHIGGKMFAMMGGRRRSQASHHFKM